ncbi:MAG: flagellar protein FlgN [Pseudomonadota bacterium]
MDLNPHLQAEHHALAAFVALLETEQNTLLSGDTDLLLTLAASKTEAVEKLNGLADARKNNLRSHGATAKDGTTGWLKAHAPTSLSVWLDIQKLAEQAQQLNRTNGLLIQNKLRYNQQALTALSSVASHIHGLYGPDGQPHLSKPGRTLGSV